MNKLARGGIYSLSTFDDGYYIPFGQDGDFLNVFKLKTDFNTNEEIVNDLETILNIHTKGYLRRLCELIDNQKFRKSCSGFVGFIPPSTLDVLSNI